MFDRCEFRGSLLLVIASTAAYGAVLACWRSPLMALYVAAKLPVVFLVTTFVVSAFCWTAAVLLEACLRYPEVLGCVFSAMATAGRILLALAPVLWIFSVSTESAAFVIVFSVALAGVAMGIAFRPVLKGAGEGTESPNKAFVIWAGLYLFVALQAVTLLRPMLGDDDGGSESRGKCFFLQHFAEAIHR